MNDDYFTPPETKIGHVHLKVTDLQRAEDFYCGLLGFKVMARYGSQAVFISAGGYHHHIGLNTWQSKNGTKAPINSPGLFHTAILYPDRKALATILKRLTDHNYPITGAADHGVSEAIYLDDPDGNGVELYCDRPKESWEFDADGNITMYTKQLDLKNLMAQLG